MFKKTVYLLSTMLLLGVISWFLYQFLILSQPREQVVKTIIIVLCIIGGYGLGQYRWRIIYIEKLRHKFWNKRSFQKKIKLWKDKRV